MTFADHGVYDPRTETGGLNAEAQRLEDQAALSWPQEQAILARLIENPACHILEVGSGSGAVTARLLTDFPTARITALEPDPDLRAIAMARLGSSERLQMVHGSIDHNALPEAAFDLIVARYVFQHLIDPVAAARRLMNYLAPGGRLVVLDVDAALWGLAEPADPSLAAIHATAAATHVGQGGDRLIGRKLWSILQMAGYQTPALETFCYHSGECGLAAFTSQLGPQRLLPAVVCGDLGFDAYLRLVEANRRFFADPQAFVLMLGFAGHGRRPD